MLSFHPDMVCSFVVVVLQNPTLRAPSALRQVKDRQKRELSAVNESVAGIVDAMKEAFVSPRLQRAGVNTITLCLHTSAQESFILRRAAFVAVVSEVLSR